MKQFINQDLYPNEFALHKKYAQSEELLDLVWTHCVIVTEIVWDLYQRLNPLIKEEIPETYLILAPLVHDIGVYQCGGYEWLPNQPPSDRPYAHHTIVGAWILKQEGYPPEVVQVANVHAGVGLTASDIENNKLELPVDDYLPITPLQKLVTYAAKFHSKSPRFKTTEEVKESLAQYGREKIEVFEDYEALFGEPNLKPLEEKYSSWHKGFQYTIDHLTAPADAAYSSVGTTQI